MKSKRATKETGTRISCIATAMKASIPAVPILNFARRPTQCRAAVSSLCLLRQVSSALSHDCRNKLRPDADEAQFATANLWHGDCISTMGSACLRRMDMARKTVAELLVDVKE